MSKKITKEEREKAIESLRDTLPPGSTVFTILRHVSSSGMSRLIDVRAIEDNEPHWLTYLVHKATQFSFDEKRECLRVGGCGMDMGFHVAYSLSATLYRDGFGCIGDKCPSNDHSNGDRDRTLNSERQIGWATCDACCELPADRRAQNHGCDVHSHWHRDGGYALRHRWM